jgi:hypothetical protein
MYATAGSRGGANRESHPEISGFEELDPVIMPIIAEVTEGLNNSVPLDERVRAVMATIDASPLLREEKHMSEPDDIIPIFLLGSLRFLGRKIIAEQYKLEKQRVPENIKNATILGRTCLYDQFLEYRKIQELPDCVVHNRLVHTAHRAEEALVNGYLEPDEIKDAAIRFVDGLVGELVGETILTKHGLDVRHAELREERRGRDLFVKGAEREVSIQIKARRDNRSRVKVYRPMHKMADIGAVITFPIDPTRNEVRFMKSERDSWRYVNDVKILAGLKKKKEPYVRRQARRH